MTTLHEIRAEYELAEKNGNDWEDVTLLHDHIGILLNNIEKLEALISSGFQQLSGRDVADALIENAELKAQLDAVEALYNKSPHYQKRYGPDDMRPPDHTVYVEFSRDELKKALGGDDEM